jgi:hypothetical protein
MNRIATLAFALAASAFASGNAQADTIFDVEHARANARAGLVSEQDAEFLRRWGRLSGSYPPPSFSAHPDRRYYRARDRRLRRW